MSLEMLPLFVVTIFILAVLPGPGVLLTVARATSGGMPNACSTVAGILVGDIIFILLVTLGLKFKELDKKNSRWFNHINRRLITHS